MLYSLYVGRLSGILDNGFTSVNMSQIERNHDSCLLALSKNGHNSDPEISLPGEEFSAVHFEKKSLSEGLVTTARSYSSQIFQLLRTGETTLNCRCYS